MDQASLGTAPADGERLCQLVLIASDGTRTAAVAMAVAWLGWLDATGMSYELRAVVAAAPLIEEMAARLRHAVLVPLNRGLALIPVSGRWLRQVAQPGREHPYPMFECLSGPLAGFLVEASVRGPVAYVEIEEMMDRTWQAAVAWSGGKLVLPPQEVLPGAAKPPGGGPVTEAFGVLGVTAEPGRDAWVSFGLYRFSRMEQWLEVPGLIGRLPQMELVWGQPEEKWAGFDFDSDYQTRAGGHSFRLRAGAARGGARYTVLEPPWGRAVLELDQLPGGWHLTKRATGP